MIDNFDYLNPDYSTVFQRRIDALARIRKDPKNNIPALRAYYRDHIPQFISDWGCTVDPRNIEIGRPAVIPFILFKRQVEFVEWVIDSWKNRRPGVCPKSRESGVSWLTIAAACSLSLFYEDLAIGFGSRKEEYVDKIGAPKSLFWKARKFLELLPPEFNLGFNPKTDAPYMRIFFRPTRSIITGEAGDNIGRGDRASIYFVDESAYLEHPELTDASLSATTNCRIDVSTAHGMSNPFYRKVKDWAKDHPDRVFKFHWRDDPRKDEAWYAKQKSELDPVVLAQEVDIDFAASIEGVVIPSGWVQAAVDAHIKLGFHPSGLRAGALDVADEGRDKNAYCGAHGMVLEYLDEWSGQGSDIFYTTSKAFQITESLEYDEFMFDSDGLGAGVRGDARVINEQRLKEGGKQISVKGFRGSEGVHNPDGQDVKGRQNKDFFANRKAQAWWLLRSRFEKTFRMIEGIQAYPHDELISIPSHLPHFQRLCQELSQPTYTTNLSGKIVIDKTPDGMASPNLADAVMIRMGGMMVSSGFYISPSVLAATASPSPLNYALRPQPSPAEPAAQGTGLWSGNIPTFDGMGRL